MPSSTMEKFHELILKLAETEPNKPLTPAAKTLLHGRLNQFLSESSAPDHPPYSAMIEMAVKEMNEERGSSEERISECMKKKYNKLPWAHSALLEHHLQKLCESGDILLTRENRYLLPTLNCQGNYDRVIRKHEQPHDKDSRLTANAAPRTKQFNDKGSRLTGNAVHHTKPRRGSHIWNYT